MTGRIVKAVSDFYYVYADGRYLACKAKGVFRKNKITPLVGDLVEVEETNTEDIEGNIIRISERTITLNRPAVANIDRVLLIFAIRDPDPNLYLLDRFLAIMENLGLEVILCFNKIDLDDTKKTGAYVKVYRDIGYTTIATSTVTGEGMDTLRGLMSGKVTSVAGPSGVGKSTIVNCLTGKQNMETGDISAKNKRGKQTTRHIELNVIGENSFIVDTPGFSNADISAIDKNLLADCFIEFAPYIENCKFDDCRHVKEPGCGIKDAIDMGIITEKRYENYLLMYEELSSLKKGGR